MAPIAQLVMVILFLAGSAAALGGVRLVQHPATRSVGLPMAIGLWIVALVAIAAIGIIAAILATRPPTK